MVAQKTLPRLKQKYRESIVQAMQEQFQYQNVMQVPKMDKIVVSIGLGEYVQNHKALDAAQHDLAQITGQKPIVVRAKKSIANFKLRQGMPIGLKVTLRGAQMYEFLDRLLSLALPRIRDFRGVSDRAFDKRGNYTIGLKEQLIFPEIVYDKIDKIRGMNITFVTTAQSDKEAYALLKEFGMPFRKSNEKQG